MITGLLLSLVIFAPGVVILTGVAFVGLLMLVEKVRQLDR